MKNKLLLFIALCQLLIFGTPLYCMQDITLWKVPLEEIPGLYCSPYKSTLATACFDNDKEKTKSLLEAGFDGNQKEYCFNGSRITPLGIAVSSSSVDTIKELFRYFDDKKVDFAQDIEFPDGTIISLLALACKEGNEEVIKLLLGHNRVDTAKGIQESDGTIISPLTIACKEGNEEVIKLLLGHNRVDTAKGIKYSNGTIISPLIIACKEDNKKVIKLLLGHNRVDTAKGMQESNGTIISPLIIACRGGNKEVIKLLLNHERVDTAKGIQGFNGAIISPLLSSIQDDNSKAIQLLLNHDRVDTAKGLQESDGTIFSPLLIACKKDNEEVIKLLVNHDRVDVNDGKKRPNGVCSSPLFHAALENDFSMVKLLHEKGALLKSRVIFANPYHITKSQEIKNYIKNQVADESLECPICLEKNFPKGTKLAFLGCCCSFYHKGCLKDVPLNDKLEKPCPVCRTPITNLDDTFECLKDYKEKEEESD